METREKNQSTHIISNGARCYRIVYEHPILGALWCAIYLQNGRIEASKETKSILNLDSLDSLPFVVVDNEIRENNGLCSEYALTEVSPEEARNCEAITSHFSHRQGHLIHQ